jgi:small subunit ribosomal protein S6
MLSYELIFLIRQDISQSQAQNIAEHFKQVIEAQGGEVPKLEYAGLKPLAYRIKKNKKAHYILLNLICPPAALQEAQRQLGLHEDILRHLAVGVEKLDPNPSALVQSRSSYKEREGQDSFYSRSDSFPKHDGGSRDVPPQSV